MWAFTFENLDQAVVPLLSLQMDQVFGVGDGLPQPSAVYRQRFHHLWTGHTGNHSYLLQHGLGLLLLTFKLITQILVGVKQMLEALF